MLRERREHGQFHGSMASAWTNTLISLSLSPDPLKTYTDLESRAFWAAVMWDTSNTLTSGLRASLTSGLKGACSEPVWRLVRAFLVGSFGPKTERWRTGGFEVSDDTASQIFSAAAVCKLYLWKNITSLKEAFREGVEEEGVLFTWKALLDAVELYNTFIKPLFKVCEKQIHFLDQMRRMTWYQVNLHHYLGILVLVDTLEVAERTDLLAQVNHERQIAEHESFNIIKFAIESTYTIHLTRGSAGDVSLTASLVALDPHSHHVLDCVTLMSKGVTSKYRQGKIKHETYSYLHLTLLKALENLPRHSKSVQKVQETLKQSYCKLDMSGPKLF